MNKHEHSHKEQKHPPHVINPGNREFQQQDQARRNSTGDRAEERNEQKDLAEQKARADQEGMTRHKQDNTPSPAPGSTGSAHRKNDQKKRDHSRDDE